MTWILHKILKTDIYSIDLRHVDTNSPEHQVHETHL